MENMEEFSESSEQSANALNQVENVLQENTVKGHNVNRTEQEEQGSDSKPLPISLENEKISKNNVEIIPESRNNSPEITLEPPVSMEQNQNLVKRNIEKINHSSCDQEPTVNDEVII